MTAIFSRCGKYRYRLDRQVQESGIVIAFFGINPSKANDIENDPTVKKWLVFAKKNNARKFIVGNIFSTVTPYVHELPENINSIDDDNELHLDSIISEADVLVPCWGTREKVPTILHPYFDMIMDKLKKSQKPIFCFGLTKSGDPKHVGRLSYETELVQLN